MSWSVSRRRGDGVGLGSLWFVLGAASKRVGFAASVRGERPEPMPLAFCPRGPRGQRRQSLIALASRCSNVRECVACPGPGSPRCASRRVRSRPGAMGGGGGDSFEQSPRSARRGRTVGHAPGSRSTPSMRRLLNQSYTHTGYTGAALFSSVLHAASPRDLPPIFLLSLTRRGRDRGLN